jgi:hypothetical protein
MVSTKIDPALLGDDPTDPAVFIKTQQSTPVFDPPPTANPSANPLFMANWQEQSQPIPPKPKARPKPKSPPALLPSTLADNLTESAIQPGDQVNETHQPITVIANPSVEPVDRLGSSVDIHLTNRQEQTKPTNGPKPKARMKPQKPSPQDPNLSLHNKKRNWADQSAFQSGR